MARSLRLERTCRGHLVLQLCLWRDTCSWLLRTVSRKLLSNSKDRNATASLGNLCLCLVIFTVKSASWCSQGSSCVSVCGHCFSHWTPLERAWPHLLFRYLYTLIRYSLWAFFPPYLAALSSFTQRKDIPFFCYLCGASLDSFHMILSYTAKSKTGPRVPDQFWIERTNDLLPLAANTPPKAAQDNICLFYCTDKLLVHFHFGAPPGSPSPFLQSCFPVWFTPEAWACSSPSAGLCTPPCSTACQPRYRFVDI